MLGLYLTIFKSHNVRSKLGTIRFCRFQQTKPSPKGLNKKGYVVYNYKFNLSPARTTAIVGVPCFLIGAGFSLYMLTKENGTDPEVVKIPKQQTMFSATTLNVVTFAGCLAMVAAVAYLSIAVPGKIVKKVILSTDHQTVTFQLYNSIRKSGIRTVSYPIQEVSAENHKVFAGKTTYYISEDAEIPNRLLFHTAVGMNRRQ